ncbi:ribonuclease H-like domain-containing protein [Tanacetum coccineum]
MCDKKNKVLFTDSECLVLSPEFKLPDENQVLLKIPRQNNMYSFNLENIVPSGGLACLIAKATIDESNKWHRRLGHVNFKKLKQTSKGKPYQRIQANKHAGQQKLLNIAGTEESIDAGDLKKRKNCSRCFVLQIVFLLLTITPVLKIDTQREGPREAEQVFLDCLNLKDLRGKRKRML